MFYDSHFGTMPENKLTYTACGAWISHMGRVRKVNEDACLFGSIFCGASTSVPVKSVLDEQQWVIAAADGIGGHKAGAYASREVVTGLSHCADISPRGVNRRLLEIHRGLHKSGAENPDLSGTGAAVVGMFASEGALYGFNVGDARLYRQQGGKLHQITEDDSVEQLLVNQGMMKANPDIRPANMHALTQSIGGSSELIHIEPHFYLLSVTREARFIICTDGLTDMVSAKDIERIAVPMLNSVAVVQALFSAAMEAGGRDNITIAVVDVEKA